MLLSRAALRLPPPCSSVVAILSFALAPVGASAQVNCTGAVHGEGDALYYDYPPGFGQCSFTGDDSDSMVAAMNAIDYAGSEMCGRWVRVTGPLGSVDVRIVDGCPTCPQGDIDLNRPAFEQIGLLSVGRVAIAWETIAAPDSGNLRILVTASSSPWYVELQARSHRYGIASIEYLGPGGYVTLPRQPWNVFVLNSGSGINGPYDDPFTVRLTDVHGQVVVVAGVPLVAGATHTTGVQFPVCNTVTAAPLAPTAPGVLLQRPMPNPFDSSTELTFELTLDAAVTLEIFDPGGRRVRSLVNAVVARGIHRVTWDGTDDSGSVVVSGVYLARVRSGEHVDSRRLVLLR